jgi:trimethylamine--corrinoid protein Co-methyltransferase
MSLAENYTGLALSDLYGQRWNPGMAPIVMDQVTGCSLYASPDRLLLGAATRDLYRYLGINLQFGSGIGHSTTTDAPKPGLQAGIEKAQAAMLNLLAGYPPVITHGGMMGPGGLVGSIEQIVIDAEIVNMLNRVARGVEVNDETLAFDLIRNMGFDGQYIEQEHTAAHFRDELWLPRIVRRVNPSAWNEEKPDMLQDARRKAKDILASTDPRALTPAQEKELDGILRSAGLPTM